MSMAEPAYWKERLDSWDRAEYANIAKRNDGLPDSFSAERIQKMRDGSDPLQNNNTNYRDPYFVVLHLKVLMESA